MYNNKTVKNVVTSQTFCLKQNGVICAIDSTTRYWIFLYHKFLTFTKNNIHSFRRNRIRQVLHRRHGGALLEEEFRL